MSDTTEQWKRVQDLFEQLVDEAPVTRSAVLDRECASDPDLRRIVEGLLAADEVSGEFISSAIESAAGALARESRIGEQVGPYRIVGELGSGGMGAVYLAERSDDAYRARVAIKFLRSSLAGPELARRFRTERQILANLVHPGIARLLDGGTTRDGTPYLVMEHIDGMPLDEWCDRQGYNVRQRVSLMRRVCDAVQHAHRSLVIHRDLKPSNILVTADGTPKLLDFGIAKLLDAGDDGASEPTLYQAMTPSYASPEQLSGRGITTATDVYSLGVVFYRLLSGAPPFELAGLSAAAVERRVIEDAPAPPSSRAPGDRVRLLRGDLDTIVLKALRKEPEERYHSPAELAADLGRWEASEPISARRSTLVYRIKSFGRRHPIGVAASALAMIALAGLATVSVVQARRATTERDRAGLRRRAAEQSTAFLVELFQLADPNTTRGDTVTAREMLDHGARRVLTGETMLADVRASLAVSLATIYRNLALFDEARPLIDTALVVRRRVNGTNTPEYAAALHERAELFYNAGEYDSTAARHREVLAIQRAQVPGDDELTEATLGGLGAALNELSQFEESERHYREALAMSRRLYGDTNVTVSTRMVDLADVLRSQAKYADAIPLLEEALARQTKALGRRHLDVAQTLNHLSRTLSLAGRHAEAVPLVREAVETQASIWGGPHPETAASLGNLAGIFGNLGRLDEAEQARRESLAILRGVYGNEHPYVGATLNSLGDLLLRRGDLPAAEQTYRDALHVHRKTLAAGNPNLGYPLTGLGRVLVASDRAREAEPLLREAYKVRSEGMPDGHWHVAASGTALGECLTKLGKAGEAVPLLRKAVESLEKTFAPADERAGRARTALAAALRTLGRTAEADSLAADR